MNIEISKRNLIALIALASLAPTSFAQQAGNRIPREKSFPAIASGKWNGPRLSDGQPNVEGHYSNTIGNHNNITNPQGGGRGGGARVPSRVSDPPDGQIPYQPWARARQQEFAAHLDNPIKPEYVEPLARCAPGWQRAALEHFGAAD